MSFLVALRQGIRRLGHPLALAKVTNNYNHGLLKKGSDFLNPVPKSRFSSLLGTINMSGAQGIGSIVDSKSLLVRYYADDSKQIDVKKNDDCPREEKEPVNHPSLKQEMYTRVVNVDGKVTATINPPSEQEKDEAGGTPVSAVATIKPSIVTRLNKSSPYKPIASPSPALISPQGLTPLMQPSLSFASGPSNLLNPEPLPNPPSDDSQKPPSDSKTDKPPAPASSEPKREEKPLSEGPPSALPSDKNPSVDASDVSNATEKSTDKQQSDIKMPTKEQIEKYLYMATVIIWDTALLIYSILRKLFDLYVLKNATFDHYWRIFLQKFNEARKELKK